MHRLPTILNDVDHERLRDAGKLFHRSFPDHAQSRHGTGHRAESTATVEAFKKHFEEGTFVFGTIKDRVFTISFEGRHRTVAIDRPTRCILAGIAKNIYRAFPKLSAGLPPIFDGEGNDAGRP